MFALKRLSDILLKICCLCIAWSINTGQVLGQDFHVTNEMQLKFHQAKTLLNTFKNDSSLLILDELMIELKGLGQANSDFGIRVQLRQAEALEKDHKNEKALAQLLQLSDLCKERGYWDVLINNLLSLARLYEKIGSKENCLSSLRQAESMIKAHEIDSLYPRYSIRISSYHRIFNNADSTLFYANEVLRTAPKYGQYELEAVGHLLTAMMLSNDNKEQAIKHYSAAGRYWKKTRDYSGYAGVMNNLAGIYTSKGDFEKALIYNDSSLLGAQLATEIGVDSKHLFYYSYKKRANLLKELGEADSAWVYINKGYKMQLSEVYKSNNEKLVEIDARYKNKKKEQRIKEQEQEIRYEKERRTWLRWGIGLLLFFTCLLAYAYFKLRYANENTKAQSAIIAATNNELSTSLKRQKVLQSELHHRVKNNLQVIISLLELHLEEADAPKARDDLQAISDRIYSMASIHGMLYQDGSTDLANIFDYTLNLCNYFANFSVERKKAIFDIDIEEDLAFNLETLMPLGIILTELLSNSFKVVKLASKEFKISIKIEAEQDGYLLLYKDSQIESDRSINEDEQRIGAYLLKSMSRQLTGTYTNKEKDNLTEIFFKEKNH